MFLIEAIKSSYAFQQICIKFHYKKWKKKNYCGKRILKHEEANLYISNNIKGDKPFFIARIGGTECEIMRQSMLKKHHLIKSYSSTIIERGLLWSGIFPNTPDYYDIFTSIYLNALKDATAFGVWFRPMEDYFIKKYSKCDTLLDFYVLYPGINNWTASLEGKRVLVVHPFTKTIEKQYHNNREKIFPNNPNLLPEFTLITYKSVVSFAGETIGYETWDEALNKMYDDISKLDFDVCLLGCGAYGLPLGSMIYNKMHKKIIHVGGSLQLLFGIDGNLYHNYDLTKHLMNEYWVYPSNEETPKNANGVENSMYWKKD